MKNTTKRIHTIVSVPLYTLFGELAPRREMGREINQMLQEYCEMKLVEAKQNGHLSPKLIAMAEKAGVYYGQDD